MWNSELAKHLQFDLVDTEGMSEQQLREIPYTVVETTSKRSNSNLKIHKSNSKSSVGATLDSWTWTWTLAEEPGMG